MILIATVEKEGKRKKKSREKERLSFKVLKDSNVMMNASLRTTSVIPPREVVITRERDGGLQYSLVNWAITN